MPLDLMSPKDALKVHLRWAKLSIGAAVKWCLCREAGRGEAVEDHPAYTTFLPPAPAPTLKTPLSKPQSGQ